MLEEDLDAVQWADGDDEEWRTDFGVPLFDELEAAQKLVLMAQVGRALFGPRVPWPMHTAVAELAIYVLYDHVVEEFEVEVFRQVNRGCKWRKWRRMVLAACRQWGFDDTYEEMTEAYGEDGDWGLPDLDSTDLGDWRDEVFYLADLVFWDRDWELADVFMDSPPDVAAKVRRQVLLRCGRATHWVYRPFRAQAVIWGSR